MSNMMSRTDFGQTNEVHLTDTTVQNTINLYIFKRSVEISLVMGQTFT